jgi:hypothetical protein
VTEDHAQGGGDRNPTGGIQHSGFLEHDDENDWDQAFEEIEDETENSGLFSENPPYIGCSDVAASEFADVDSLESPDEIAERHRPDDITDQDHEQERKEKETHCASGLCCFLDLRYIS